MPLENILPRINLYTADEVLTNVVPDQASYSASHEQTVNIIKQKQLLEKGDKVGIGRGITYRLLSSQNKKRDAANKNSFFHHRKEGVL
ncbi:hypothetical protein [Listeria ilorinensis]|uniref:hypothetical protein n=1 Tax=Listeria ilorinensis TaxID=2867439 RepID=UPI001EF532D0|nr:hypothetical protein [Listeria ilorinensis]